MRSDFFAHRPLFKMDKSDRIRASYLHACLKFVKSLATRAIRNRTRNEAAGSRLSKESHGGGCDRAARRKRCAEAHPVVRGTIVDALLTRRLSRGRRIAIVSQQQ